MTRVSAFIDGFNLYHALDDLRKPHLMWLNLRELCKHFAPEPQYQLTDIFYFSAYATWRLNAYKRHKEYVKALESVGITPVMGKFKEKDRSCFKCGYKWKNHEEKETDVNIALYMMLSASKNICDRILLISADSDLAPAIRMIRTEFPSIAVKVLTPVQREHSLDLLHAADGKKHASKIQLIHIERSLFPKEVKDSQGNTVVIRPAKYDPH